MGRRDENSFHSLAPVNFLQDNSGNITGWSQTIRQVLPEQSPSWTKRCNGGFTRPQVYPCNEGFPGVVRIGPLQGGLPVMFDVVLSNGMRASALVSTELIDELPSWVLMDDNRTKVSYYDVAGWASPTPPGGYDWVERVIIWLTRHLP